MLVLVLPPVSSRVSGFPVASPCLWGKLQNLSFCHVANCENWRKSRTKCEFFCIHVSCLESLVFLWRRRVYGGSWKTCPFRMFPSKVVMLFCVADVALSDIPTCLMMFTQFQNWRNSRRKCWFFCIHVSCRESLVFLWRRRVYEGSWKTCPFRMFPSKVVMLFCVADVALSDIPTCLIMFTQFQNWRNSRRKCWFFCIHVSCRESLVFLWRRRVYEGSWKTCPI